jgi:DNA-binding HxlR family transcriptional regulator
VEYGQFCPIAKATEVIGEKWTILIIREILMGGTRFSQLQRGLSMISPAVLTKRLKSLSDAGLIVKKRIPGQRGWEYHPTESCRELLPILLQLGNWGLRWTRDRLSASDYDVSLLMLYLERSIIPDKLIGEETTIRFHFTDLESKPNWWILVNGRDIDVCTADPGRDVDVFFTTTVRTMTDVWMEQMSYRAAIRNDELTVVGLPELTRNITTWLAGSAFDGLPSASEI